MDADFHISVLHDHLIRVIQSGHSSKILYIQADNSAAESKNKYFLYFCGILVHLGIFDEVHYSTMIPGHTHEDIDQLFQAIHTYLARNSAMTFKELLDSVQKAYNSPPKVEFFQQGLAWKNWFQQFCNPISKHKSLHCFCIKRPSADQVKTYKISNLPRLFVKSRSTEEQWDGGVEGLGYILFQSQPTGTPQRKLPTYCNLPEIEFQKFSNFMSEEQLEHWTELVSTSGQKLIPKDQLQTIFDIATTKPKVEEKVQKTTTNLLKTKKVEEHVQEWRVSRILGERINKETHQREYQVEWEAGDITYEEESQFIGTDGSENEAFSVYKQNRKRTRSNRNCPSKKAKK